jgi:xanthine dehydrogenase large subunit
MPVVGKNIPHESAAQHALGRSIFVDDIPCQRDELFLEIFRSPVAHAQITSIDLSEARSAPEVIAILTAQDIPGKRAVGPVVADEMLLADNVVNYVGEPLAIIAATSRIAAKSARNKVRVEYVPLPPILSLQSAIAAASYLGNQRRIVRGDPDAELDRAEVILEGELTIEGQEHFYLEPQSAIAYPGDGDSLRVISSTQHPSEVQAIVAEVLGWPFHRVIVECYRMGGGFGGKETQAAQPAAFAALVAWRTGRPARIVFCRDDDMACTGKRHPFFAKYKVGFRRSGEIQALVIDLVSDGGCSTDLSPSVLERAMLHVDNAYYLPSVRITGRVARTNFPSNTAFRGFGGPQGIACIENILEEIAFATGKDSLGVRQLNCYGVSKRNTTPYGQCLENNLLPKLMSDLRKSSHYDQRHAEIEHANRSDPEFLRGIAITPVKFGIAFTKTTLNQASALVNIYLDGSVLVSTGATEMGQGVQTRIRQLVADELGVLFETVRVAVTSTDKNNNTSPTAASCGTDLNGAAAMEAAGRLRQRLAAFAVQQKLFRTAERDPTEADIEFLDSTVFARNAPAERLSFEAVVRAAYAHRVSLGERGFYATPGIGWDQILGQGSPFLYFTQGAAAAEVCIDRFTGELSVPRVDILMDVGRPINPGIDRGQITGGFIQGMGWCTTESLKYDTAGSLLTHSPTTYKIPNIADVPPDFRIAFYEHDESLRSLRGSKAVGEPPFLLGISVWVAIRRAIMGARSSPHPRLSIPATHERILLSLAGD